MGDDRLITVIVTGSGGADDVISIVHDTPRVGQIITINRAEAADLRDQLIQMLNLTARIPNNETR